MLGFLFKGTSSFSSALLPFPPPPPLSFLFLSLFHSTSSTFSRVIWSHSFVSHLSLPNVLLCPVHSQLSSAQLQLSALSLEPPARIRLPGFFFIYSSSPCLVLSLSLFCLCSLHSFCFVHSFFYLLFYLVTLITPRPSLLFSSSSFLVYFFFFIEQEETIVSFTAAITVRSCFTSASHRRALV
jgi:hypothetical protein